MSNDCSYCRHTPRGIDGHDALFIVDIRPGPDFAVGTPVFKCSVCSALWAREYRGGGAFRWRLALIQREESRKAG